MRRVFKYIQHCKVSAPTVLNVTFLAMFKIFIVSDLPLFNSTCNVSDDARFH